MSDLYHFDKRHGGMLVYCVTADEVKEAKRIQAIRDKKGIRDELTKDRWIGRLGEIVFGHYLDVLGIDSIWYRDDDLPYDFTIDGHEVDTKTQAITVSMQPGYYLNVSQRQACNRPGDYFFLVYEAPKAMMWLAGGVDRPRFMQISIPVSHGEPMPGGNRQPCPNDMYCVRQNQTLPPAEWVDTLPARDFPAIPAF